jgi:hypothetical protein
LLANWLRTKQTSNAKNSYTLNNMPQHTKHIGMQYCVFALLCCQMPMVWQLDKMFHKFCVLV